MWLEKVYAGILVGRVHRMTGGLIDDDQEGFRMGKGCVDQIFTLRSYVRKHKRKKFSFCGFYRFGEGI